MGASLTRRVRFHASHRYHRPDWDEATNRAAFGACAAPEPHAHDYRCDVSVRGEIGATGMIVDLGFLDRILDDEVVRPLDGSFINEALAEFGPGGLIPTCEELARLVARRVDAALATAGATARVAWVRVAEDDSLSATWTADG